MEPRSITARTIPQGVRTAHERSVDRRGAQAWAFARAVWAQLVRIPDYYDEADRRSRELRQAHRRPGGPA